MRVCVRVWVWVWVCGCDFVQVDVLVSVVGKDFDMRKTAVGKAVLEWSGSQEKEVHFFLSLNGSQSLP